MGTDGCEALHVNGSGMTAQGENAKLPQMRSLGGNPWTVRRAQNVPLYERIRMRAADWQSLSVSWTERKISPNYCKASTPLRPSGTARRRRPGHGRGP